MFDLPDDQILPLSKEHVFYTWSAQAKVNPIPVKRAKGVYFWDINDKRYLDFNSMKSPPIFSASRSASVDLPELVVPTTTIFL